MAFAVKIRQIAEPLGVGMGETILAAAQAAGIAYPFGCQSGNCGGCKSTLYAGEVEMSPYSEFALTEAERDAGLILACRAVPWSDCEVAWLEQDEVAAHALRHLDCTVTSVEPLTHDIKRLRLKVQRGGPYHFSAGQYATLTFDGLPPRDYSMANAPDDETLEFHVRAVDGGAVSRFVARDLKPGDAVRVDGPFGIAHFRETHTGPIIAVAGGSGLAPILCIVQRALQMDPDRPITLYFGVRDEPDLYKLAELEGMAVRHARFRFVPVLSQATASTTRRTGFVADALRTDAPDVHGAKAYLAGPPVMVETAIAALNALGLPRQDCHADAFYTAADKARLEAAA